MPAVAHCAVCEGPQLTEKRMNALLVILDGLSDRGTETPLGKAKTPNFDRLAAESQCGMMYSIGRGVLPGSDTSHLAIFGYDPHIYYKGRGTFEALGAGMSMSQGEVAFRINLATVDDDMTVVDRRAGRDPYLMDRIFAEMHGVVIEDVTVNLKHTVEHRGAMTLSGPGLSHEITNADPHETGAKVCEVKALAPAGEKTARVMNAFTRLSAERLSACEANSKRAAKGLKPANIMLARGAGYFEAVPSLQERYGMKSVCIAGGALYKGVARYVGMDIKEVEGATGTTATDLAAKADACLNAGKDYQLVFCHIKGTDACGHDGQFDKKREFIERIDSEFAPRIAGKFDVIVITADHSTPVSVKRHSADPTPLIFCNRDCRVDAVDCFSEAACAGGSLGILEGRHVMPLCQDYLDVARMYGE